MAPRQNARAQAPSRAAAARTSADDVAAFVGTTLGELMNRKDALVEQLASVERQIAVTRDRIKAAVRGQAGSRKASRKSAKPVTPGERKGNRKRKRPLPPDDPAAVKARTRVAQAEAKGRVSERLRTSMRSGNR